MHDRRCCPLEDAFNQYTKVLGVWGDCLDGYYCDFSEGESNRIAQDAANASRLIDKSRGTPGSHGV